jgi:hypothetical protein
MLFLRFAGVTSPPSLSDAERGKVLVFGGRMSLGLIVVCVGLVVVIGKGFIVIEGSVPSSSSPKGAIARAPLENPTRLSPAGKIRSAL